MRAPPSLFPIPPLVSWSLSACGVFSNTHLPKPSVSAPLCLHLFYVATQPPVTRYACLRAVLRVPSFILSILPFVSWSLSACGVLSITLLPKPSVSVPLCLHLLYVATQPRVTRACLRAVLRVPAIILSIFSFVAWSLSACGVFSNTLLPKPSVSVHLFLSYLVPC